MDCLKANRSRLAHLAAHGTPADRDTARQISVGLEKTLGRYELEIFPYLKSGGTEIQFVYGANGRGKSHYLLSVEEIARRHGFVTARIDCPVGDSPFKSLRSTYEMVAGSLAPPSSSAEDVGTGVSAIVQHAFSGARPRPAAEVITGLKASKHLLPEFRNLLLAYGRASTEHPVLDRVKEDLETLMSGSQSRTVTISSLYRSSASLPRPLGKLTSRNAANWLRSLLSTPYALGYPGAVILFDETERAFHHLSRAALQEQLAHLRNIVDYCALGAFGGCLILYAAAEDFISLARENLDALAQRIEPPTLSPAAGLGSSIRSVWTDLEDLTWPRTSDADFFRLLAEKIVQLGVRSGLSAKTADRLRSRLNSEAAAFANSPTNSIVRQFVKRTATDVLSEVNRRG